VALKLNAQYACFGGSVGFYSHPSTTCHSEMKFSVYTPPQAKLAPVPVLYFLSGLTCTEENFMIKAGAQQFAAKYGVMLVAPDTSPRNTGIAAEEGDWELGTGAGFYVDATEMPWRSHYHMYSYVVDELPALIAANFAVRIGLCVAKPRSLSFCVCVCADRCADSVPLGTEGVYKLPWL
jgi:S-formylglutathione hydrolase